jgi:cold shock CspA family protein
MTLKSGTITSWKDDKGFGFITPKSGGTSVFIHINNYSKKHKRPIHGLSVKYKLSTDSEGRKFAVDVFPEKGNRKTTKADGQKLFSIILSSIFLCIVCGLVVLNKLCPFGKPA